MPTAYRIVSSILSISSSSAVGWVIPPQLARPTAFAANAVSGASAATAMSFRELRNFKEIMATLGYPRLISIENFKVPHFELVADALEWLCHRYDKNMEILSDIRTEQDRVAFLKSVAEQLLVKARVKLNLKNLYASNGFAVRELLKVATLLHDAHKNASLDQEEAEEAMTVDIGPGLWPLHGTPTLTLTLTLTLTPHLSLSPSPVAPPNPGQAISSRTSS